MSIEFTLRCDHSGCGLVLGFRGSGFLSYKDTLEDVLETAYEDDWLVQGEAIQPRVWCPEHRPEEE